MAHGIKNVFKLLNHHGNPRGALHTSLTQSEVSKLWAEANVNKINLDPNDFLNGWVRHSDPDAEFISITEIYPIR
jgi:hypothetical protein